MSFTCPVCRMTSHHPEDERQGYCGNCHDFTGEKTRWEALGEAAGISDRVEVPCKWKRRRGTIPAAAS